MLAKYLNNDPFGKKMQLPVIRLQKNTYLIGLTKWIMRLSTNYRLEVKGENSDKWFDLR